MGKGSAVRAVRATLEEVGAGLVREVEAAAAEGERLGAVEELTVFDADVDAMPTISLQDYLNRWLSYSGCSTSSIVAAGVYLERCPVQLNLRNMHRLLLVALIVAAKYLDDTFFSNTFYAAVGGSSLVEVNRLETAFLTACEWEMFVSTSAYDAAVSRFLEPELPTSPVAAFISTSFQELTSLTKEMHNKTTSAVSKKGPEQPVMLSCTDIFLGLIGL